MSSSTTSAAAAATAGASTAASPASAVVEVPAANSGDLQIYFCASIRGGVVSKPALPALIAHLKNNHGRVLTEHIAYEQCEAVETTDQAIYDRDVAWLKSSDVVVAECSAVSLGVGYELAYAEMLGKPILVLYRWPREDGKRLSAMIAGNTAYPKLTVSYYKDEEEAKRIMSEWIRKQ